MLLNSKFYYLFLKASGRKRLERGAIAIIDDGFALELQEFQELGFVFGYDVESQASHPLPRSSMDKHGTRVAGLLFAEPNGIGVNGIAPKAKLIAIRHPGAWTSEIIQSFYIAKLGGVDVVNCSWRVFSRIRFWSYV